MKSEKTCRYVFLNSRIDRYGQLVIRSRGVGDPCHEIRVEIEDVCGSSRRYGDDGTAWDCDADSARDEFGIDLDSDDEE